MMSEPIVLEWGNDQDRQPARDRTLSEEGLEMRSGLPGERGIG